MKENDGRPHSCCLKPSEGTAWFLRFLWLCNRYISGKGAESGAETGVFCLMQLFMGGKKADFQILLAKGGKIFHPKNISCCL